MIMKKCFTYLIIASFLMMTACTIKSGDNTEIKESTEKRTEERNKDKTDESTEERTDGKVESESGPLQPDVPKVTEKTVTLGIEGYKKEVEFQEYQNDWVKLWVDSSLQVTEEDKKIYVYDDEQELTFSVKYMDSRLSQEEKYEEIEREMIASGYRLINEFSLETKTGEGYIFYSGEDRQSIDVYFLRDETAKEFSILVQFVIPEEMMEQYISRFEYMLETIEIIS